MLSKTSTEWAPWHVIPADRKWFARVAASAVLAHAMMEMDPRFPAVSDEERLRLAEAKEALEAEAPKGAASDPFEQRRDGRRGEADSAGGCQPRARDPARGTAGGAKLARGL
jgi:hypothetical protein